MKVLVYAHRLELGGTQTNAIELSATLRDNHGFDVVMFATPGPMVDSVNERGLRFIPAPDVRIHPSRARMQALRAVVDAEQPDVLHVWDWWQCLDAFYSVHLPRRLPMVVTDMMMDLTRVLPRHLPTSFGTPEIVDCARSAGRPRVHLIVPPVDIHRNAPDTAAARAFRDELRIAPGEILLVTVSRLAHSMKLESLCRCIDACRRLAPLLPIRLVIVGDGAGRDELDDLANEANAELGRSAVILTGGMLDPRPAYAAADIVIGMGGSALRGMAFGKPVIVVGEDGYSAPFTPETAESLYYRGMYGRGDGRPDNERLVGDVQYWVERPDRLPELGAFARSFVVERFSLDTVASRLAELLREAVHQRPSLAAASSDALRTAAVYLRYRLFASPSRDPWPKPGR